jgi:hypothetical protein
VEKIIRLLKVENKWTNPRFFVVRVKTFYHPKSNKILSSEDFGRYLNKNFNNFYLCLYFVLTHIN